MHSKKILLVLLCSAFHSVFAQNYNYPIERTYLLSVEDKLNTKDNYLHTSIQPYTTNDFQKYFNEDSLANGVQYKFKKQTFLYRALNHFTNDYLIPIHADSGKVNIYATPLFDFSYARDSKNQKNYYQNTRGLLIRGNIGSKLTFQTGFYESQARFPEYINRFIDSNGVVPAQALSKNFKGSKDQDYNIPFASIIYTPSKYFTFQLGQDKNFIGNGYRSLLLSDNATNYPAFKIVANVWRIKYLCMYQQMQNAVGNQLTILGSGYPKKYATTHYINFKATKSLEIGLFESIIWQAADSNSYRGFDWAYLNPIIFLRPTEFYGGSADNALMGLNIKYQWFNNFYTYGQIIIDDLKFDELKKSKSNYPQKYGFQLGARWFNVAKIKGLALQGEWNYVMPYTYTHRLSGQNYSHNNQSLAHPQNANFIEYIGLIDYTKKRLSVGTKLVYCVYGADTSANTNFGHNIMADISNYPNFYQGNQMLQGIKTTTLHYTLTVAYIINPKINMRIEGQLTYRTTNQHNKEEKYLIAGIGFKTSLFNRYSDF